MNNFTFLGTPEISKKTLEILKNNGYLPSLVITNPDARSGRGMRLKPSAVAIWAKENNIPVLKELDIDKIKTNLVIVVAYGKILPEEMVNKFNIINIHYSLLPKYRGASPVESAILNGDEYTGVSIQKMRFKLDSGPILAKEKVKIEDETKDILLNKLIEIGGNLLIKILPEIDRIEPREQNESQATFCKKIKKEDGLIDLRDDPIKNYNKYRAYYGWPGTYYFNSNEVRCKITKAKLENDQFIIEKIIPAGKKEISI